MRRTVVFERAKRNPAPVVADLRTSTGRGKTKLPSAQLITWIDDWGITNGQELADLCLYVCGIETTRAGISNWRKNHGRSLRTTSPNKRLVPWRIAPQHADHKFIRALRAEMRRRDGHLVNPPDESRRRAVLKELAEKRMVIDYDLDVGPHLVVPGPRDLDLVREYTPPRRGGQY